MKHVEEANRSSQNQPRTKHKILVVDDVVTIARKLQAALPEDRFQVVGARRLREALQLLKGDSFAMVVVDAYLPDDGNLEGGVRLVRNVREELNLPEIPMVMYSNFALHIREGRTTRKDYKRVREEMKKYKVPKFIDKNWDEKGELGLNSIEELAEYITSKLER